MIIVPDSSTLALLINPNARPPNDPATGEATISAHERVSHLIESLAPLDTLIIPTPVLSELLVKAEESAPEVLASLQNLSKVRVAPFDERAAIEVAAMTRAAIDAGDKRGGSFQPWQKVKIDRQIIAIARVAGADFIYADDQGLVAFARLLGMNAKSTWELPIPEEEVNLFTTFGVDLDPSKK